MNATRARRGRPPTGKAVSAAERMRRMRARRKAAGLQLQSRWVRVATINGPVVASSNHRLHDIRGLAAHAMIARKIGRDRGLLAIPRGNLQRWRRRFVSQPPLWWREWDRLLRRPWLELEAILTDAGEGATWLRQSSPFAGVLTPAERKQLYDAFRT